MEEKNWSNWKDPGYIPSEHGWKKATIDEAGNFGYPLNYNFADSMRAALIAFGNYFNDLWVVRCDEHGVPRKSIRVPLKFGPRAKSHDMRTELESGKTYYIQQPNMYYKMTSIGYDENRAMSVDCVRTFYDEYLYTAGVTENTVDQLWEDVSPVPYNIGIEMTASVDKMDDANQIIEQIATKFNPESWLYVKEFWFMNIRRDIKMTMDSVSLEYNEDFGEEDKRDITCKFSFKLELMFYKGIEYGSVIDKIVTTLNPHTVTYNEDYAPSRVIDIVTHEGNYNGSADKRYDMVNLKDGEALYEKDWLWHNEKVNTLFKTKVEHKVEEIVMHHKDARMEADLKRLEEVRQAEIEREKKRNETNGGN